jgi:hypothetical protein
VLGRDLPTTGQRVLHVILLLINTVSRVRAALLTHMIREVCVWGDSRSTYERGSSLGGLLGRLCQYKRFLSCLMAALVSPVQNIFFLT